MHSFEVEWSDGWGNAHLSFPVASYFHNAEWFVVIIDDYGQPRVLRVVNDLGRGQKYRRLEAEFLINT
jgi:hypothetical protein